MSSSVHVNNKNKDILIINAIKIYQFQISIQIQKILQLTI